MTATKRNELLKEFSDKLKDQMTPQSGKTFRTRQETSGVIRSEHLRKNPALSERSRNITDSV